MKEMARFEALWRSIEGDAGMDEVRRYLAEGGDVNGREGRGHGTLLHRAAQSGNLELIALLADAGADPNAQGKFGDTPLHIAAVCDIESVVAVRSSDREVTFPTAKALLRAGADPRIRNAEGRSPSEEIGCVYSSALRKRFDAIVAEIQGTQR